MSYPPRAPVVEGSAQQLPSEPASGPREQAAAPLVERGRSPERVPARPVLRPASPAQVKASLPGLLLLAPGSPQRGSAP
jgi:hypothetical protein